MDTLTADPPQAGAEPAAAAATGGGPHEPAAGPAQPGPQAPVCKRCGAAMAPGQDWCLQCGAAAPGSVGSPGWRPAGAIIAGVAVLVLAAAGVGYAALSKSPRKAAVVTRTVAAAAPAPAAPLTSTPPPTVKTAIPPPSAKAPRIPPITATPKPALTPTAPATRPTGTSTTPTSPASGGAATPEEPASTAIVLDTNAASTYNPYGYPTSIFGDPSLAIDGDSSTGWTAQVQAASAPRMAEGLVVDLKTAQRIAALKLVTTTPGMTVQVYGANSKALPNSITDPAWVPLSHSTVVKKRHASLTLHESKHAFRFVTLWVSSAPASSTPQAPGRVTVNELELLPAR